jgi:thiamine-phosphate pyrophosphorylase
MIAYLITDPAFFGQTSDSIAARISSIQKRFDYACLRDKTLDEAAYREIAPAFVQACRDRGAKAILHTFWRLALEIGAFVVHLSSSDYDEIPRAKAAGLFVVASAHSLDEAAHAIALGADLITIGPIFYVEAKNPPIGLAGLKEITAKIPTKCIALGGILEIEQAEACALAGAVGFASRRHFVS